MNRTPREQRERRHAVAWAILLAIAIGVAVAIFLGGCVSSTRDTDGNARTVERTVVQPTADGGTVTTKIAETATREHAQGQTSIDVPPVIAGAVGIAASAATGGWSSTIQAVLGLLVGASTAAATVYRSNSNRHQADADEAWDRLAPPPSNQPPASGTSPQG